MENEIAYLKTEDGLDFRLTNDKLYITGPTGMETFALRSINGIGVIDLIDKYNDVLAGIKAGKAFFRTIGMALFALAGIFLVIAAVGKMPVMFIFVVVLFYFGFRQFKKFNGIEPELKSSVRIMLNGMNRDFEFNKRKVNSTDVANFVARVEDTLTAFHKN